MFEKKVILEHFKFEVVENAIMVVDMLNDVNTATLKYNGVAFVIVDSTFEDSAVKYDMFHIAQTHKGELLYILGV